jgi:hypothetical protein
MEKLENRFGCNAGDTAAVNNWTFISEASYNICSNIILAQAHQYF